MGKLSVKLEGNNLFIHPVLKNIAFTPEGLAFKLSFGKWEKYDYQSKHAYKAHGVLTLHNFDKGFGVGVSANKTFVECLLGETVEKRCVRIDCLKPISWENFKQTKHLFDSDLKKNLELTVPDLTTPVFKPMPSKESENTSECVSDVEPNQPPKRRVLLEAQAAYQMSRAFKDERLDFLDICVRAIETACKHGKTETSISPHFTPEINKQVSSELIDAGYKVVFMSSKFYMSWMPQFRSESQIPKKSANDCID